MIVCFFKSGKGKAAGALGYLLGKETPTGPINYLLGKKTHAGVVRTPAPVVLRGGDPKLMAALVDASPRQWKYTSGVLSFTEKITPTMEEKIMEEFERTAFAGLTTPEHYSVLWVRHSHLHRTELHFLVPRQEVQTGASLNIAPPGKASRALFNAFRDKVNAEFGLSDPDDPARRRALSLPAYIAKLKTRPGQSRADHSAAVRESITRFLQDKARAGLIKTRADVITILRQSGFTVPRQSQHYITVATAAGERYRLRGAWYEEQLVRGNVPPPPMPRPDAKRAAALTAELERLRAERAAYHVKTYGPSPGAAAPSLPAYDRTRSQSPRCPQTVGSPLARPRPGTPEYAHRFNLAAQRFRGAVLGLGRTYERFSRSARSFAERITQGLARFAERSQIQALLRKYAVPTVARPRHDREPEMEMEMEL